MVKSPKLSFFKICYFTNIYFIVFLALPFVNLIKINYYLQLQIQIPIILNASLILILIFRRKKNKQSISFPLAVLPIYIAMNITYHWLWNSQLIFFIDILLKFYLFFLVASDFEFSQSILKKLGFSISIFILMHIIYAYYALFIDNSNQQNILFSNFFLGVFDNPTKLTNYCIVFFPIILKYCSISSIVKQKDVFSTINLVIILLFTFILIKNNSRINLFILLAIIIFRYKIIKNLSAFNKVTFIGIILMLFLFTTKLFVDKSNSFYGRILILKVTSNIIKTNFWIGTGFNTYEFQYNKFQGNYFAGSKNDNEIILADNNYVAHNEFMQIFSELGFIGLSIILVLIFYLLSILSQKIITYYSLPLFDFIIILLILSTFSYPFRISETRDAIFLNTLILFPFRSFYKNNSSILVKNGALSSVCVTILSIISLTYAIIYQYELYSWSKRCDFYFNYQKKTEQTYFLINNNKSFLYTMAAINLEESNYQSALFLIDKLEGIRLSSNICMLKAQIYKHMDNPILALSEYKKASNINPKLLRPKYEIMKYYQYLNKPQYAKLWAKEIIKTPVKIKSSITELIQKRAKKTLIE